MQRGRFKSPGYFIFLALPCPALGGPVVAGTVEFSSLHAAVSGERRASCGSPAMCSPRESARVSWLVRRLWLLVADLGHSQGCFQFCVPFGFSVRSEKSGVEG